jgi:hypothetical protein
VAELKDLAALEHARVPNVSSMWDAARLRLKSSQLLQSEVGSQSTVSKVENGKIRMPKHLALVFATVNRKNLRHVEACIRILETYRHDAQVDAYPRWPHAGAARR